MTQLSTGVLHPAPLLEVRADFPVFTHRPELVFLDSAASSQKPAVVIDAVSGFYSHDYANIHRGAYRLSARATDRFEAVRDQAAQFFCAPSRDGVVSFNVAGAHAHDVAGFLDEANICVRAGHHCAQPLMRALNVAGTVRADTVRADTMRASFWVHTTPADVDALADALGEIVQFFGQTP